jgi:hypothetical protein
MILAKSAEALGKKQEAIDAYQKVIDIVSYEINDD